MKRFELLEDEKVLIDEPIHWKNYLTSLLTMTMCIFLMMLRWNLRDGNLINHFAGKVLVDPPVNRLLVLLEMFLLLSLFLASLVRTIDISYIHYYVTTRRIISTSGVINRQFSEMLLSRCEMVYLTQNAYERMYNCGDILCVSAGAQLFLDDVKDAVRFKQTLMDQLSKRDKEPVNI